MTEIINGVVSHNETTKNAMGGTELIAQRMVNNIDPDLLKQFDIIFSRIGELNPDKRKILYLHDLPNDPMYEKLQDKQFQNQFELFVFVSHWQMQMFNLVLGIPYSRSIVIKNAINPIEYKDRDWSGTLRMIYHTTPHRGLELLYPVFEHLSQMHDIHLDVFSSFAAYGWDHRDQHYQPLFDKLIAHDKITYHGFQPNHIVRDALQEAHIFAYPCIWTETSCLALIEALSAGCLAIYPNLGALPETGSFLGSCYQWSEDKQHHMNRFATVLNHDLTNIRNVPKENCESMSMNVANLANSEYNLNKFVNKWQSALRGLINNEK